MADAQPEFLWVFRHHRDGVSRVIVLTMDSFRRQGFVQVAKRTVRTRSSRPIGMPDHSVAVRIGVELELREIDWFLAVASEQRTKPRP